MIDAPAITVDREQALELYKRYKAHAAYSQPVDAEIANAFYQISKGRMVVAALAAVVRAGLTATGMPRLAIGPADAAECHCMIYMDGSAMMSATQWPRQRVTPASTRAYQFERGSFEAVTRHQSAKALTPYIPPPHRPKRALQNYALLWEAEWMPNVPPKDPLLLRRIGKADLWLVLAAWDLTDIEATVLAGRTLLGRRS